MKQIQLKVTEKVAQSGHQQITVIGLPAHKDGQRCKKLTSTVDFEVKSRKFSLTVGDTHGIHPSHQTEEQAKSFKMLYEALCKTPDVSYTVEATITDNEHSANDGLSKLFDF